MSDWNGQLAGLPLGQKPAVIGEGDKTRGQILSTKEVIEIREDEDDSHLSDFPRVQKSDCSPEDIRRGLRLRR